MFHLLVAVAPTYSGRHRGRDFAEKWGFQNLARAVGSRELAAMLGQVWSVTGFYFIGDAFSGFAAVAGYF